MKVDDGFVESEKMLNELEAKIKKEYLQAYKEMDEKVLNYYAKFKKQDEEQRARYEAGEITKKEYTEWRLRKMATGKQYKQMRNTLVSDLTKTAQIAMKYVDDKAIDVYALNMNYGTYLIEHETEIDTTFTLYNHDAVQRLIKDNPDLLPQPKPDSIKAERWNLQHLQSAITQGLLQGESIAKIAKRMQRVTNMERSAAIRNARTAMTGAQNGGRLDSMKRAQERGIEVKKGWLATLDGRTRDSHAAMDGEEVELDETFSNKLMFPGDANGAPSEVYNCRCRMVHVFPKYRTDWSNMENRNTDKLGDMTYEEWKNKHKERLEKKQNKVATTKTIKSNKEYQKESAALLKEIYENHRIKNNMTSVPAAELPDDFFNKAHYGGIDAESVKAFNDTIAELSQKYDTSLSEIRLMNKMEYVGKKNSFAFTYHSYDTDTATMVINPAKCGKYDKLTERITELVKNGYAVKIDESLVNKYVVTHEFAHTLIDMQTPLDAKRNWVGADYGKIKAARKEIENVYADYLKKSQTLEKEYKKYELDFLNTFNQESADKARKYKEQLDAMTISKYGNVNSDEFMAECFTHAQLGGKQNDYVDRIMDIIEKHFGR